MYHWKRSHASEIVFVFYYWKLVIFPLKGFVLSIGKNFARSDLEHFTYVLMSSLLA